MASIILSSNKSLVIDKVLEELAPLNDIPANKIAILHDKIAKHFQEPRNRKHVQDEICQLAETLLTIEENFSTINRNLCRIDDDKLVVVKGKPRVFAVEWRKLHSEYTELVQKSQATANKIKSKISTLNLIVIPTLQSTSHIAEKQRELERYTANLSGFEQEASQVEDRFRRLGEEVDAFRRTLKETVAHQLDSASSGTKERIAEIEAEIKVLQDELERIGGFYGGAKNVLILATPIAIKMVGVATTASGGILAAVGAITALAPIVTGSILVTAIAAAVGHSLSAGIIMHNAQKKAKKQAIHLLADERERLTHKNPKLLALSQELNKLDATFDGIIFRLSSIQGIWHLLVIDTQNLRSDLDNLAISHKNKAVFERKLRSVKALFETLYYALDQYTLQVRV